MCPLNGHIFCLYDKGYTNTIIKQTSYIMKKLTFTLILCSLLAVSTGYARRSSMLVASSTLTTKTIPNVGIFNAISNSGDVDVAFRQSTDGSTSVSLYGSSNLLEYVKVDNMNGTLNVRFDPPHNTVIVNERQLKLTVTSPNINSIIVSGSGDVDMYGIINTQSFIVTISGSGDFNCDRITGTSMNIMISGRGDAEIDFMKFQSVSFAGSGSGEAEMGVIEAASTNIDLKGSGDFECETIVCADVALSTSGSGDIDIESLSAKTLAVLTKGSGSVTLKGDVIDADFSTAGSGGISALGLKAINVSASNSGSGDIACYAMKSLNAKTTGSGAIMYTGNPMSKKTEGNIKTK